MRRRILHSNTNTNSNPKPNAFTNAKTQNNTHSSTGVYTDSHTFSSADAYTDTSFWHKQSNAYTHKYPGSSRDGNGSGTFDTDGNRTCGYSCG